MKALKRLAGQAVFLAMVFGLVGPAPVSAATAPTLGLAAPFSAWGKAGVTNNSNVGTTHHWGDVGADLQANITNLDDATQVDGTIQGPTAGVQTAISNAYGQLTAQGPGVILNLAGTPTVGPGTYDIAATTMNGTLTLDGAGVYVFLGSSTTPVSVGAQMNLINGACASDVYWAIADSMTIGADAHVEGTIITNTSLISLGTNTTLKGRALSHIAQVTMTNSQITEPTCAAAGPSGPNTGTINVVKTVINDNGSTKTVADFSLFVSGTPVSSGITNTFPAIPGVYTVTETGSAGYARTFSGDCDANGGMNLTRGQNKFCIVTNNDIGAPVVVPPVPPLINVLKVPSPLSLPQGPGAVTYTYSLDNIGTVPVTNVTMVGDTCSPIVRVSGDTDGDSQLDVNEIWVHTCSTTLTQTHTNTVVATGWANGLTATDIASATVVVGLPVVPPLINVTKVPSPLTLLAGGGMVTYTEKITNPGTVPLSNVGLTDDKCGPMQFVSGDSDNDSQLDVSETWTYTCSSNLTATTTNTATASGTANGLTVRDFAIATVVVAAAVPTLPVAGIAPEGLSLAWGISALGILSASLLLFVILKRRSA